MVGTLPDGLTTPHNSSGTTWPSSAPWFQTSITVSAASIHGRIIGAELFSTTTAFGLAVSRAATIASWL